MTLSSHAVVGAAMASLIPSNPPLGFVLALASHYALDAIPHWDYQLKSSIADVRDKLNDDIKIDRNFIVDLIKIFLDMSTGVILSVVIFVFLHPAGWLPVACGVIGGVLPDGLQFVYMKTRFVFLSYAQRFHHFMHFNHGQKRLDVTPFVGIGLQAITVFVAVCLSFFIR